MINKIGKFTYEEIRDYLLCNISDEKRNLVDVEIISERISIEELDLVEDLIIEDYFDGRLNPIQKRNFEKYFLMVESRRWKLRIQQLLDHFANEEKDEKKD